MANDMTAPIALFVYNRPDHTQKTIEALQKNDLANESDIYIFSDAAKSSDVNIQVQQVRNYISTVAGFKSVNIVEREYNWGLAASIINGVTQLCNSHEQVIVLEDDIITSKGFLSFMNTALSLYAKDTRVMHISGYMFHVNEPDELPETFFYRVPSCWGWATWKRAWDHFEADPIKLLDQIDITKKKYDFDIENSYPYREMLSRQASGKLNSWAIRWYASVFVNFGLCLHPKKSFTNNIGLDGSGTHCGTDNTYEIIDLKIHFTHFPRECIKENSLALQKIKQFNNDNVPSLYQRIVRKILKIISKF